MQRHAKSTILPRYTPRNWWECDVCEITATGYMREFEIKTSRSDFKVDAQKMREVGRMIFGQGPRQMETKHDLLARGDPRGPSCFYFVTPAGLLQEHEIPLWAGLIEVRRAPGHSYPLDQIVKKAPRLHKQKADEGVRRGMLQVTYGRLHHVWWEQYHRFRDDRYVRERDRQRQGEPEYSI